MVSPIFIEKTCNEVSKEWVNSNQSSNFWQVEIRCLEVCSAQARCEAALLLQSGGEEIGCAPPRISNVGGTYISSARRGRVAFYPINIPPLTLITWPVI